MLETRDRAGGIAATPELARPLELGRRRFGCRRLLLHDAAPEGDRLGVVVERGAQLRRGRQQDRCCVARGLPVRGLGEGRGGTGAVVSREHEEGTA